MAQKPNFGFSINPKKGHNSPADWAREMFKPSKYPEIFWFRLKTWEVLDMSFFVGDVILGIGLGFFGLRHSALGLNLKGQFFFFQKKIRQESASLYPWLGF